MRLRFPYRRQVEATGRLYSRYGPLWFTVVHAAHVIDEDGVSRLCRDRRRYEDTVRRRLKRLVDKGMLDVMRHPSPRTRQPVLQFRVSDEGRYLIDVYHQHAEFQRDMDDVLDLL